MLAEEHWVPVPGFPNYEVSNMGRVVNIKTGVDLKPRTTNLGYVQVALYDKGIRMDRVIHRIVAQAFFVDYDDNIEVRHINGDKTENTVRNLTLGAKKRIAVRIVENGMEFDSLLACGSYLGGDSRGVSNVINDPKRHKSYKGYTFEVIDK